jgi:hypothetical protein
MAAKVFISCGQRESGDERRVAAELQRWFKEEKRFEAYAAYRVQSLDDAMTILGELETSDYFVFIDFRRECLLDLGCGDGETPQFRGFRGSVFSHQELALAHHLGFEHNVILLRHRDVIQEGFLAYIQGNPETFDTADEAICKVKHQVGEKNWSPAFSRHLVAVLGDKPGAPIWYGDHTTGGKPRQLYVWGVTIRNLRHDRSALNVTATLKAFSRIDTNQSIASPDNTWLKWAGHHRTYSMVIPPRDERSFDAFAADAGHPDRLLLNSLLDIVEPDPDTAGFSRRPLTSDAGTYRLRYRIDSIGFPALEFEIELTLRAAWGETNARLI